MIHRELYAFFKNICIEGKEEEEWFNKVITYLVPEGTSTSGKDFRPITCMSNLYKLTTKCAAHALQIIVVSKLVLCKNQIEQSLECKVLKNMR